MKSKEAGRVIFVGAGPGAPDLLTVRAVRELEQADVVLHDALGCESALQFCPQARLIAVGKRAGGISTEQVFINRLLVSEASSGGRIVRLKGGDPVIFGRLDEEISALLQNQIRFEIVPGITAASAAASAAGVPLTKRGVARSLTIATPAVQRGTAKTTGWLEHCDPQGTTAVYMAGRELNKTAQALLQRGYPGDTPVKIAWSVSTDAQRFSDTSLAALASAVKSPQAPQLSDGPCLLLVGQAVASPQIGTRAGTQSHKASGWINREFTQEVSA